MGSDTTGFIFDIKRYALHDGPGIRTTAFLKGCHLGCPWCQNPEGISRAKQLWYHAERCIRCGACIQACPHDALSANPRGERFIRIDRDLCRTAGHCTRICPSGALEFDSRRIAAGQLVQEFLKDEIFYQTSGGGITLSGGEPLDQPDFCRAVLSLCREAGLHTALETSLSSPRALVADVAASTDLFLADLKIWDPAVHQDLIGVDRSLILENIRFLAGLGVPIRVRTPLVPGYTADKENLRSIAGFVRSLRGDVRLELINFNPLAAGKYQSLGRSYALADQRAPLSPEQVAVFNAIVRDEGVSMDSTGARIAVDIGATKIVVAYTEGGEIYQVDRIPTAQDAGTAAGQIRELIGRSPVGGRVRAVGIGSPGPLNPITGEIISPPNLPGWHGFPLAPELEKALNVPVRLENDANLGALGEAVHGSGKGCTSMFYLTLSTGIGAGLIIDGRIFGGHRGIAGEVYAIEPGHFYGRNTGENIIELASGPGLVRQALRAMDNGRKTILEREGLDPRALIAAVDRGDPLATEILNTGRNALAGLLIMVLTTLAPDAIVLAGGLCNESHFYVEPVKQRVREWLTIPELTEIPIRRAALWDSAVLYGAAELVRDL